MNGTLENKQCYDEQLDARDGVSDQYTNLSGRELSDDLLRERFEVQYFRYRRITPDYDHKVNA